MKIRGTLLLAACCALCAPAARAGGELQKAREAAALGSEARAFDIAMDGLKAAPGDRELFLLAVEMLPENSPARAKRLSAAAAEMIGGRSDDYAWHLGACKSLRVLSKTPEALSSCKRALETDPTTYPVYRELGLTYAAAGNPRKAAETLSQGVEIASSSYQAHYHLARVLERRGDFARAAAAYQKGLALARGDGGLEGGYYRALLKAGLKRTSQRKETRRLPEPSPADRARLAAACAARFRAEFLKDNLGTAISESETCLKLSPADPALAAERAPILVRLGRYEEGVREYERAASLYPKGGQQAAMCRVKAAETWQKLGKPEKALEQYRLAVADRPQDPGALWGLAAALEARSDFAGAVGAYEDILKAEPGNEKARARRDALKSSTLSSAQILEELRLRRAVDEKKTTPQPEDIKLFKSIRAAEISGAADFLKHKSKSMQGLTISSRTQEGAKVLLTGAGYRAYVFHATRDAVKFFESEKVDMREIFKLRTLSGADIFDRSGRLTDDGLELWRGSIPGRKTWLNTYEPVPASPQAVQADKDISEAEKLGYREISEPEYLWLLRATDCPEDVMRKPPVDMRVVSDGARVRYLLCYVHNSLCMNPVNEKLPPYIERYRSGDDSLSDSKTSTAFFGTGAVKKHRFCEGGKVWGGETEGVKFGP